MRIIVTGAAGRLGKRLAHILSHENEVVGADRGRLDVTDFGSVCAFVQGVKPDVVVHTAAWTDVEGCARDPQRAVVINGYGTQNIALAAARIGAAVLYVSTNEVFDGHAHRPYAEYDRTNPINPYGYSKVVGEETLLHLNSKHYIVRTAWLFAHGGNNFLHTILKLAHEGKSLQVVGDEIANPTYSDDLADAIAKLIKTERFGIYHFANNGECSRYELARYVLDQTDQGNVGITQIRSAEWKRLSTPPLHTNLANNEGEYVGITLRRWQDAVDSFLITEGKFLDTK